MKIGYVRVSTKEQNTARQEEIMKSLEVDKVYPVSYTHLRAHETSV